MALGPHSNSSCRQNSSFERFANRLHEQIQGPVGVRHTAFTAIAQSPDPSSRLCELLHLDLDCLLELRLVCTAFRRLISPIIFRNVRYSYPPLLSPVHDPQSRRYDSYDSIKHHIKSLYLKVRPTSKTDFNPDLQLLENLLDLSHLECLTIELLDNDYAGKDEADSELPTSLWMWSRDNLLDPNGTVARSHHYTLVNLRGALEHNGQSLTRLDTLIFKNLSITGVQSLRYKSFSANSLKQHQGDNGGWRGAFWPRIKRLNIRMVKWWDVEHQKQPPLSSQRRRPGFSALGERPRLRLEAVAHRDGEDEKRQGIFQLHDWLKGFSNDLVELQWQWIELSSEALGPVSAPANTTHGQWTPCQGLNPLMLDKEGSEKKRMSSKEVVWNRLEKLTLGGTDINMDTLATLQQRMKNLKELLVPCGCIVTGVEYDGVRHDSDGLIWAAIKIIKPSVPSSTFCSLASFIMHCGSVQ